MLLLLFKMPLLFPLSLPQNHCETCVQGFWCWARVQRFRGLVQRFVFCITLWSWSHRKTLSGIWRGPIKKVIFTNFCWYDMKEKCQMQIKVSSLNWLILGLLYTIFVRWSILPTEANSYPIPPPSPTFWAPKLFLHRFSIFTINDKVYSS